jgi:hypothetical protein
MAKFLIKPERIREPGFGGRTLFNKPSISTKDDPVMTRVLEEHFKKLFDYVDNRLWLEKKQSPKFDELMIEGITMQGVFVCQRHDEGIYTLSIDNLP